jgi:hypothetical protein
VPDFGRFGYPHHAGRHARSESDRTADLSCR